MKAFRFSIKPLHSTLLHLHIKYIKATRHCQYKLLHILLKYNKLWMDKQEPTKCGGKIMKIFEIKIILESVYEFLSGGCVLCEPFFRQSRVQMKLLDQKFCVRERPFITNTMQKLNQNIPPIQITFKIKNMNFNARRRL